MGSVRTWSLAAVAGIFVVVVAHQRSNADAGRAPRPRRRLWPPQAASAPPASRVTGLPDFSGLVAENGAAVVNISVVEKPQQHAGAPPAATRATTTTRSRSSSTVSRCRVPSTCRPPTASAPGSS